MNAIFEYLEDKCIVQITITGTYDFDSEPEVLKKLVLLHEEHNSKRSLFDFREGTIVAKILTTYSRPKLYEELGIKRSRKAAILLKELNEDLQFWENVTVNRGWNIKLFIDYDAAIEWLTK